MLNEVDVAVVGGGPAGFAAAVEAARHGLAVTLVEPGRVGGPPAMLAWRVLERSVDEHLARGEAKRGPVWAQTRRETARLAARWEARLRLRLADAGVDVVDARGRFTGPREIEVDGGSAVRFERAVIACGAAPRTLEGDAPDAEVLVTPADLLTLEALPADVMVLGGGAAGAELVDALSRITDVDVTWVMGELGLLPRFERELAEALGDVLMSRGVKLVHGKRIERLGVDRGQGALAKLDGGRTYGAPLGVLCLGRRAEPGALGLDAVGLRTLDVDGRCRTAVEGLFAAGECTGRAWSTAAAEAMGRAAGAACAGADPGEVDLSLVPLTVHAHPQLSQVGLTPERAAGRRVSLRTLRGEETLHGLLHGVSETDQAKGFCRIVCDSETGALLGASAAGPGAADLVSAAAVALRLDATDAQLAGAFTDLPGALDALVRAAR